jgi:YVTN family beta-propeller protein
MQRKEILLKMANIRWQVPERTLAGEAVVMKLGKSWKTGIFCLAAVLLSAAGCSSGSKSNVVTVTVSPSQFILIVNQSQAFTATVGGATDTTVTWKCTFTTTTTDSTGKQTTSTPAACTSADGTLSSTTDTTITYTAPALVQNPAHTITLTATANADPKKTGTAQIAIDSGIRVSVTPTTATIGTGEQFKFTDSVTNDTTPPKGVTWAVTADATATTKSTSCAPGCGSVDANGNYTAPSTVPTQTTVTVYAVSVADPNRGGQATVTLVSSTSNPINFTGIFPTTAPQGGTLLDVYLNVTNLRSTVAVQFNGQTIDPTSDQLKIITTTTTTTSGSTTTTTTSSNLARLRLNSANLSLSLGSYPISVVDPSGATTSFNIQLVPSTPALVATSPNSFAQNATGGNFVMNGGFYGSGTNPLVQALLNETAQGAPVVTSRQMLIPVTSQLQTAGLFPVRVVNNGAGLSSGTTNVAIEPDYTGANGSANNYSLNQAGIALNGNAAPSSIAIDSAAGLAVVVEQGTNKVQVLNIAPGGTVTPGAEVAVGNSPTSVAIDDQQAPPLAAVVNSADSTLTLLQLPSGAVISTVDLSGLVPVAGGVTPPTPYAVGIDPFSHRALVAFSKTNVGFIVNLDGTATVTCLAGKTPPYCPVSSVTLNTGESPQVALEPKTHLAFVTPGGAGLLSVVDLTQKNETFTIQDAPNGAVRSNGVVTIKTVELNDINPAVGGTVIISGVADASFNGSFSISSVLSDGHTFTYVQAGADATSGGGTVSIGNPVLTFSVSNTIRGISINSISRTAMLADPNASSAQLSFIRTLDQSVSSLSLAVGSYLNNAGTGPEVGFRFTAFQPNLNVGLAFNPQRNEVSLIDPSRPQRLAQAIFLGQNPGDPGIGCIPSCNDPSPVQVFGGIAVDPSNNIALIANAGLNRVQILTLSDPAQTKNVAINQVLLTSGGIPSSLLAQATVTSSSPLTNVRILGSGFVSTSQVRLDRTALPAGNVHFVNSQEIDVDIPASFLSGPHHYALDVVSNGAASNATDFFVLQIVDLSTLCPGTSSNPSPEGVAIDETRNIAVVANTGCNSVSFISLKPDATFGTVTNTIAVGSAPVGIAVNSRLGFAVVSNSGSGTASVINLDTATVTATPTVGTSPNGVAINPDTGQALVINTGSNTVSAFDITQASPTVFTGATVQSPIAIAVDPDGNNGNGVAAVTGLQIGGSLQAFGSLSVLNLSSNGAPTQSTTLSISTISATPTGIAYDPAGSSPLFYVVSSQANSVATYNPNTGSTSTFRVGINPTSIASNYQTGAILTLNSSSNTMSIIDARTFQTRATLSFGSTSPFGAAIYPTTNLAVISDQANNRVVLFPLPE